MQKNKIYYQQLGCESIELNINLVHEECVGVEKFTKQNMPSSVAEIMRDKTMTRERAKALERANQVRDNDELNGLIFPS